MPSTTAVLVVLGAAGMLVLVLGVDYLLSRRAGRRLAAGHREGHGTSASEGIAAAGHLNSVGDQAHGNLRGRRRPSDPGDA